MDGQAERVGRAIRARREVLGLRLEELADWLGVSAVYVRRLEAGTAGNPGEALLRRVARILETDSWRLQAGDVAFGGRWCPEDSDTVAGATSPLAAAVERFLRQQRRPGPG